MSAEVHRLHPLSLVFRVGAAVRSLFVPLVLLVFFSSRSDDLDWIFWAAGVSVVYAVFQYVTYRYRFDGDEMVVQGGLIFRFERHIPYERVQNIDLSQSVFHRLFKVADVRIETASGSEAEARLQVLSLEAVEAMRERVFGHRDAASRGAPAEGAVDGATEGAGGGDAAAAPWSRAPAAPEVEVLRLSTEDVVLFGLLSNRGLAVVAAAAGLAWELDLWGPVEDVDIPLEEAGTVSAWWIVGALLALVVLLRVLSVGWALVNLHGFRLARVGDDLQTRCGLLTRLTATLPRQRIQAVTVTSSLLQRLAGRVSVKVDTAGGNELEGTASTRSWVAPLLPEAAVPGLLVELLPGLREDVLSGPWERPHVDGLRRVLRRRLVVLAGLSLAAAALLSGWALAVGVAFVPLVVWDARRRLARLGCRLTDDVFVVRSGLWSRRTRVVRTSRAQVITRRRSPFDRRWGMASLGVDVAGTLSRTRMPLLPDRVAEDLASELTRKVLHPRAGGSAV